MPKCKVMSGVNDRKEWRWFTSIGCCPVICQCIGKKTTVEFLDPNFFFDKKANQFIEYAFYWSNHNKNPSAFNSDNSRTKRDMKNHFSELTQKTDLIYLLWKLKLLKASFNSRVFFTKLPTNIKMLSFVKAQW